MKRDKEFYYCMFVSALILSNILSYKIITIGWLSVPGGVVCYAVTFLMGDIIGEKFGKRASRDVMLYGLVCQIICSALIGLTLILPSANKEFNSLLSFSIYSAIASLVSYIVAQTVDILIFHKIRDRLSANSKLKFVWNNISTITAQILDTLIFVFIAFGLFGGLGIKILLNMILSQILVKTILALLDTPLFYLFTRNKKQTTENVNKDSN